MRKLLPVAVLALFALGACSSSDTNSGGVTGAGTGMGNQGGYGAGMRPGVGDLAQAKSELMSIGDRVYFTTDGSTLTPDAKATLTKQVAWLNRNPQIRLIIEGHADERGTREYNLGLGERRAEAVKNYLISSGISSSRLRTVSYGKERPSEMGSNDRSWSKNRRGVSTIEG